MAGYTTAMCGSAKAEMASAYHCFLATAGITADLTSGAAQASGVSSVTGLCVGMSMSGVGIQAGSILASIDSASLFTLSKVANATGTNVAVSGIGDAFKIALGIPSPTGTYGASTTNYSNLTGNSDEVANGSGYVTGGQAFVNNISPANSAGNSYWQWSVNPSWTSASFSTRAAIIYNTSNRASTNNRSISVHDFGGTQQVTSGTLTLLQPTNGASTSLLQIN